MGKSEKDWTERGERIKGGLYLVKEDKLRK